MAGSNPSIDALFEGFVDQNEEKVSVDPSEDCKDSGAEASTTNNKSSIRARSMRTTQPRLEPTISLGLDELLLFKRDYPLDVELVPVSDYSRKYPLIG